MKEMEKLEIRATVAEHFNYLRLGDNNRGVDLTIEELENWWDYLTSEAPAADVLDLIRNDLDLLDIVASIIYPRSKTAVNDLALHVLGSEMRDRFSSAYDYTLLFEVCANKQKRINQLESDIKEMHSRALRAIRHCPSNDSTPLS